MHWIGDLTRSLWPTPETLVEWKRKRRRVGYFGCWPASILWVIALMLTFDLVRSTKEEDTKIADLVANVSHLLDTLLAEENYDRQIRPGFGGEPTIILTDIEIRSFGPLSENDMIYSMDCYFRQTWWDDRLRFSRGAMDVLSMDWKFLKKVWTPDTYFFNGKSSHLHKVTVPNKFIRLRQDGQLKYSMRITIKANCPMHLRKYPLDTQACPLEIGSFGYTSKDVIYRWKGPNPVIMAPDVTLSQYAFLNVTTANVTEVKATGVKKSSIKARFMLQRRRGYFILQIYAPCAMIVGASWVAFWINRHDPAGRVTVGATTVLTLVTMGFTGRASLPRANYPTALDWFVIMCFTFVFTALVEYACVNFVDRWEKSHKEKKKEKIRNLVALRQHEEEMRLQEELRLQREAEMLEVQETEEMDDEEEEEVSRSHLDADESNHQLQPNEPHLQSLEDVQTLQITLAMEDDRKSNCIQRLKGRLRRRRRRKSRLYREMALSQLQLELVEEDPVEANFTAIAARMDATARVAFPMTFACLNIFYWTMYLYIIDDEIPPFHTDNIDA